MRKCNCSGNCYPQGDGFSRRQFVRPVGTGVAMSLAGPSAWGAFELSSDALGQWKRSLSAARVYSSAIHRDARMHPGGIGTGDFKIGADGQLTTWQLFNTLRDGQVPFYFGIKTGSVILLAFALQIISAAAQVAPGYFQNPINSGPDPWMVYCDGNYYLSTTQGNAIRLWKAPTLEGLKTAPPVTVWTDTNTTRSAGIWAPEVHFLDHHWYMYYTATSSDESDDNHRIYVLEGAGDTPLGPYKYKARLFNPANDHYAIDPTVFQNDVDGSMYLIWAARPGHVLYIARMANPYTLEGNGVYLPADGFGCANVREGPEILQRNGRIFLIYSICDTGTPDYKLGMLFADEKSNLMDARSWKQYPRPLLERDDASQVFGPGHCGFFKSPDGTEDWIVYHAKTTSAYTYAGRTTRAQKFGWNADGTPDLGVPLPLSAVIREPSNRLQQK